MDALTALGVAVWGSAAIFGLFVWVDARAAFDHDDVTHTASEKIKRWRRKAAWRTVALSAAIGALALIPVYLFAHLVLELV